MSTNSQIEDIYQNALQEAKKKKPDCDKVLRSLNICEAEKHPAGTYALATWYLHGTHVKKNLKEGLRLLRKAADLNVPEALYDLGVSYEKGKGWGIAKNEKLAARSYLRAALLGDAQSVYEVGRCYYYGIGVEQDKYIGKIWLDHARNLGIYE